jgi:hypothetical protein
MSPRLLVSALLTFGPATLLAAPTLVGFASLPADTLIPGPTSGQFIDPASPNGRTTPFTDQQPVQGFSSVIAGQGGRFLALSDNGFGSQDNSADALLQIHELEIDFRTQGGGSGGVTVVQSKALSDPNDQVDFTIVAEMTNYPNSSIAVDSAIASARLLTGADFDQESFRRDANGNYWIGDEFGPFLYKTNAQFELLRAPVRTPGVQAPQNPFLGSGTPNLPTSRGYEGMAISQDGMTLFPMLEGTVTGDPDGTLRIYEFDVALEAFTDKQWLYPLSDPGHAIGELTQIDDEQFLVIERDWNEGDAAAFKKVFRIDLTDLDPSSGQLRKTADAIFDCVVDAYLDRPRALRLLDQERQMTPDWFERPGMIGYVFYPRLFAGTLQDLRARLDYLQEMDISLPAHHVPARAAARQERRRLRHQGLSPRQPGAGQQRRPGCLDRRAARARHVALRRPGPESHGKGACLGAIRHRRRPRLPRLLLQLRRTANSPMPMSGRCPRSFRTRPRAASPSCPRWPAAVAGSGPPSTLPVGPELRQPGGVPRDAGHHVLPGQPGHRRAAAGCGALPVEAPRHRLPEPAGGLPAHSGLSRAAADRGPGGHLQGRGHRAAATTCVRYIGVKATVGKAASWPTTTSSWSTSGAGWQPARRH